MNYCSNAGAKVRCFFYCASLILFIFFSFLPFTSSPLVYCYLQLKIFFVIFAPAEAEGYSMGCLAWLVLKNVFKFILVLLITRLYLLNKSPKLLLLAPIGMASFACDPKFLNWLLRASQEKIEWIAGTIQLQIKTKLSLRMEN